MDPQNVLVSFRYAGVLFLIVIGVGGILSAQFGAESTSPIYFVAATVAGGAALPGSYGWIRRVGTRLP